jgi:hypothetical protein
MSGSGSGDRFPAPPRRLVAPGLRVHRALVQGGEADLELGYAVA